MTPRAIAAIPQRRYIVKKALAFMLAALLICPALAGCWGNDQAQPTDTSAPEAQGTPTPEPTKEPLPEIDIYHYYITVYIDREESFEFKSYGPEDFPEVDCIAVIDMDPERERDVKELIEKGEDPDSIEYCKALRLVLSDTCAGDPDGEAGKLYERGHVQFASGGCVDSISPDSKYYYGVFSGCDVWFSSSILAMEEEKIIGGYSFFYGYCFYIWVAKDKIVYDLGTAYNLGLVTDEDLAELSVIHKRVTGV